MTGYSSADRPNYQPRAFSGLLPHRYGENLKNRDGTVRQVYVPGKDRPRPILNKDKHKHVVEQTASVLGDWTTTKFEHEGACRAGLRAAWCLAGYDWTRSDAAAIKVVAEALDKIGARRPTWEQGQREHTDPVDCCSWCKGQIPDELFYRPTPARYCSDICARSAMQHRDFEARASTDAAYRAASAIISTHKQPIRTCACCKKKFRTREAVQVYCSELCANRHRAISQQFSNTCHCCGTVFTATYSGAVYCSSSCRSKFAMLASGRWKPKRLGPVVFDFYVTTPVNASRPAWLTPKRFDELIAA